MNIDVQLDAKETSCSELTQLIYQTMQSMVHGQILEVLARDQVADIDISAWCRMTGNVIVARSTDTSPQRYFIQKMDQRNAF
jgi:TusA-related sulfurtransferase